MHVCYINIICIMLSPLDLGAPGQPPTPLLWGYCFHLSHLLIGHETVRNKPFILFKASPSLVGDVPSPHHFPMGTTFQTFFCSFWNHHFVPLSFKFYAQISFWISLHFFVPSHRNLIKMVFLTVLFRSPILDQPIRPKAISYFIEAIFSLN